MPVETVGSRDGRDILPEQILQSAAHGLLVRSDHQKIVAALADDPMGGLKMSVYRVNGEYCAVQF